SHAGGGKDHRRSPFSKEAEPSRLKIRDRRNGTRGRGTAVGQAFQPAKKLERPHDVPGRLESLPARSRTRNEEARTASTLPGPRSLSPVRTDLVLYLHTVVTSHIGSPSPPPACGRRR